MAPKINARLRHALRRAGSREIGGILFAEQLAPAHFRIMDLSFDLYSGSHTHFQRDPRAHDKALNEFFERTGRDFSRFNYLGEWHSHPSFPVMPSIEDMETMQALVENTGGAVSFALLLIVRLRFWFFMDYSLTTFVRGFSPQRSRLTSTLI
jgi:integrative and conjugative element protein (TIGR02256 family)